MNPLQFWFKNARPHALVQSIMPAILATCIALQSTHFSPMLALMGFAGIICAHLAVNLFDDYFDYLVKNTEYRDDLAHQGFRARIAKCAYLTSGATTQSTLLKVALLFGLLALAAGGIIFIERGGLILGFITITGILGIGYSAPPFRFSYHGLGEVLVGIMFGPLLMTGIYFSACGTITPGIIFISIPVGLLVANLIFIHSILDYHADKEVGKKTFAVLLGNQKNMLFALALLLYSAFACILVGVFYGYLPPLYGSVTILLPFAFVLYQSVNNFVRKPEQTVTRKWWMGPMKNWGNIEKAGIDWFMLRWYMARNLLLFFCCILILSTFIAPL